MNMFQLWLPVFLYVRASVYIWPAYPAADKQQHRHAELGGTKGPVYVSAAMGHLHKQDKDRTIVDIIKPPGLVQLGRFAHGANANTARLEKAS